ncbi:MAG TPA: hypothetical protein VM884_03400 [Flavisolibacter sp.]|jgi:hypothetical protein|nr:hypothetical protein [Flavisolibacter sp.]
MQYITLLDYLILPFVVGIIFVIAYRIRNKKYPRQHPWRKYYLAALGVKVAGAVFNGMLHYYYYGGGDTFNFFFHSGIINSSLDESFIKWINLLFRLPAFDSIDYYRYTSQMYWYNDPSSYTVAAFAAILSLFTFGTYLPAAALFAFISFSGTWAMFRTFSGLYPHLTRQIAIITLFIPTTILWGSGIYKDTICMFGLGWLTHGIFRFLVQKDYSIKNILLAVISFLLIAAVKIYVLIAFMPALAMWVLFNYTQLIKNKALKQGVKFITLVTIAGLSSLLMSVYSSKLGSYSLDNIAGKAEETREWIQYSSDQQEGSTYTLGEFDPSIGGMLTKFPQAVNVTLFRPYLWESKKVIMLLSAIESLLFLILTLRVLFIVRPRNVWRSIGQEPTIQFCLIFSIIFAFSVGITTYNFGSLSRYKIPCLPFYALAMILIYYKNKPLTTKLLPFVKL